MTHGEQRDQSIVSRSRSLPLWRQVKNEIERDILKGILAAGERLPTEAALAERFAVHRHTVRRAVEALRDRNLIRVEHGRGIFVREQTIPYALGPQSRLTTTLRELSRTNDRRVISSRRASADQETAGALSIREGGPVREVVLLTSIQGTPVSFAKMYFPLPRFQGIEEFILATGSISKAFALLGAEKYRRRETRIGAKLPSPEEAIALGQPRSSPVITIRSVDVDEKDLPIAFSRSCSPSRWMELVVKF